MSLLLKLLPFQYYIAAAALAVTLGGWGAQTWRLHIAQTKAAEVKAELAGVLEKATNAALLATTAYRAEETRRTAAITGIVNETVAQAQAVAADAAAARDSHDRLLQRVRTLGSSGGQGPGHPPLTQGSTAASGPGLLLADVLGRIDTRAGQLGEYADQARTAGLACERSYEALTP